MPFEAPALYDSSANDQIKVVRSFEELCSTPWSDGVNALCWQRVLLGDYGQVARAIVTTDAVLSLDERFLRGLRVREAGRTAVESMLQDLRALQERDLLPELNLIRAYPREDEPGVVPLDVYSFHADSATAQADTYLCTYFGRASEALRNDEAFRYVDRPDIRAALLADFGGPDGAAFEEFLRDNGYDLHYGTLPGARPFSFGIGNLWRIATRCPGNLVPPCIHRAPAPRPEDPPRLLLIS